MSMPTREARTALVRLLMLAGERGETVNDPRYAEVFESLVTLHAALRNFPYHDGARQDLLNVVEGFRRRVEEALEGDGKVVDDLIQFATESWTNSIKPQEVRSYLETMRARAEAQAASA
jgi:hypothetical protein